ncbi:MAG: YraN family protein [Deltaproteobacteria bacterium]|nr:YraN family protein [Deltaproteobacteria bacterium]
MTAHSTIGTGKKGEDIAVEYLKHAGYRIIERNYRCVFGEIDIVAQDGDTTVFVEVKSRRSARFGEPQAAVGPAKQRKLSMISLNYLKDKGLLNSKARFDVVAVRLSPSGHSVNLIPNAFDVAF